MTTEAYDIGDLRRFTVALTDVNDAAADPTELTLTVLKPDGSSTVYSYSESPSAIGRTAPGSFYVDVPIEQTGRHYARWAATGALVTAEQFEFFARHRQAS